MNIVDSLIFVIFLLSIVVGVWRGFSREVISLASLFLALVLARQLCNALTEALDDWVGVSGLWVPIFSFVGLFLLVILVGHIILFFIQSFVQKIGLQGWERFGGGVFGFLRALLLLLAFGLIVDLASLSNRSWATESFSVRGATYINQLVNLDWAKTTVTEVTEQVKEEIQEELETRFD